MTNKLYLSIVFLLSFTLTTLVQPPYLSETSHFVNKQTYPNAFNTSTTISFSILNDLYQVIGKSRILPINKYDLLEIKFPEFKFNSIKIDHNKNET